MVWLSEQVLVFFFVTDKSDNIRKYNSLFGVQNIAFIPPELHVDFTGHDDTGL